MTSSESKIKVNNILHLLSYSKIFVPTYSFLTHVKSNIKLYYLSRTNLICPRNTRPKYIIYTNIAV